jgi:hypothetical protein
MAALSQASANYGGITSKPVVPQLVLTPSGRPFPSQSQDPPQRDVSLADDTSAVHRPLITSRIEKMEKGEAIYPPCDRCRRLKTSCVKHLTACQGCTKKHAKCSWKTVTEEEAAWLKREMAAAGEVEWEQDACDAGESKSASQGDETAAGASRPSSVGDITLRSTFEANIGSGSRPKSSMEIDVEGQGRVERDTRGGVGSSLTLGRHSLLSHMASVASARADARDASSSASNTPRS